MMELSVLSMSSNNFFGKVLPVPPDAFNKKIFPINLERSVSSNGHFSDIF